MACNGEMHTTRMKHFFGERLPHVFSLVTVFSLFPVIFYYMNYADNVALQNHVYLEKIYTG